MTITKRAGVYFTETQGAVATADEGVNFIPLFIVQTTTAIASIDDKITLFANADAFATVAQNKGLTKTIKYIREALGEAGRNQFYVYSIKTDTAAAFTSLIEECASRTEIRDVVYIEETKSSGTTTITAKVSAIATALDDNYEKGTLRNGLIVPYGTVTDAVTNADNTTAEEAVVTSMTAVLNGVTSGRITGIVPDDACVGAGIGKFIGRQYNDEIGSTPFNSSIDALTYNFNDTQILALCNIGCLVVTGSYVRGAMEYRVEVGCTASMKNSTADQLLISRSIADQLLRDVKVECDAFIRTKLTTNTVKLLQGEIDSVVADYVANEDVLNAGTKLTVSQSNVPYTLNVNGSIQVAGSLLVINIDTTITA